MARLGQQDQEGQGRVQRASRVTRLRGAGKALANHRAGSRLHPRVSVQEGLLSSRVAGGGGEEGPLQGVAGEAGGEGGGQG